MTYGIKVYIPDQLLQVCLFLTDNGFISILKKPAVAFVAVVEAHGVSREEPSHQGGKGDESGSKEEMGVVRNEHPCVTECFGLGQEFGKALQEIIPVSVFEEDLLTVDTPDHDVVKGSRCV
jgi:hypothetical protein